MSQMKNVGVSLAVPSATYGVRRRRDYLGYRERNQPQPMDGERTSINSGRRSRIGAPNQESGSNNSPATMARVTSVRQDERANRQHFHRSTAVLHRSPPTAMVPMLLLGSCGHSFIIECTFTNESVLVVCHILLSICMSKVESNISI